MRDCYDTAVLCFIGCRCMGILLGRDPRCPGAAIHEGIPGVVAGMICLGAFFPTGCYRTFYGRIGCFDIIGQICIHVVRTGGFRIESESSHGTLPNTSSTIDFLSSMENIQIQKSLVLYFSRNSVQGSPNRDSAISSPYFS